MNQRISQPFTPQSSRAAKDRQHGVLRRATALLASAVAAGAFAVVISNSISGGGGVQGAGHNVTAAGAVSLENGVITGDDGVTPADNGVITGDEAVTPADNGVISGNGVIAYDNGVINAD